MLFYCVLLFLGSVSVSYSAPLTCEELVQPLDQLDPGHLDGKWALIAGSISHLPYLEKFGQRDSAAIYFPSNARGPQISYTRATRVDNKCHYNTYNITLNGSSFTFDGTPERNSTSIFVKTSCSDCLIMRFDMETQNRTHFYFFSRRRELGQEEMQEFTKQVQCLHMPPPAIMDPTKEICPEQAQD